MVTGQDLTPELIGTMDRIRRINNQIEQVTVDTDNNLEQDLRPLREEVASVISETDIIGRYVSVVQRPGVPSIPIVRWSEVSAGEGRTFKSLGGRNYRIGRTLTLWRDWPQKAKGVVAGIENLGEYIPLLVVRLPFHIGPANMFTAKITDDRGMPLVKVEEAKPPFGIPFEPSSSQNELVG